MANSSNTKLALLGGTPVRPPEKTWPAWPVFGNPERMALNEVLESGEWWFGERVKQFERDYAAFQDAKYCVTCATGSAAAEICLQAMGIGQGDEVIVPPYTFIATASTVMRVGGIPVFADVDDSWCLNPDAVEAAITPRTKAIVPVHFAGRIADMDRINAIAAKHGITVMEDACHSWGGKWKGKGTGALGKAGVFSFQNSKNITAAEGGAILTDDEALAETCKSITNCGRGKGSAWYHHVMVGTNARISEFAAALLSAQLTRLERQTLLREHNAAILDQGLAGMESPSNPAIRAYRAAPFTSTVSASTRRSSAAPARDLSRLPKPKGCPSARATRRRCTSNPYSRTAGKAEITRNAIALSPKTSAIAAECGSSTRSSSARKRICTTSCASSKKLKATSASKRCR
jgi:dTDP-4-amino-4,6-dideoxygalactose transaminase